MSFALWGYYKVITLETTVTQSDYQLCFTVNRSSGTDSGYTLYVGTDCNADYSDIRFSSDDEETTFNYFVEPEYTSSSARIWVKVPSLTDSLKIRMHYGNVSTTSAASGSGTFAQYVENQTSTYNLSGACAYAANCVGHVTLTSGTFDVLVGIKCSTYNVYTGSTPEYRHTVWTDTEGYHDRASYSVQWTYPSSHSFSIIVTNDDMDVYQDNSNIEHIDYGIGSSGTDIGMQAYTLTGARVDWAGLARYATQVLTPSEITTVSKVKVYNQIGFDPVSTMRYSNSITADIPITVDSVNKIRSSNSRPQGYYNFRKITLTNSASTGFDDFQLIFNVHRAAGTDSDFDIYVGTNCKEDYSDIVFTDVNGTTPLSHYIIPPYTSSVAKVLVKINHIDASSSRDIYIYYNNPTATSTSNKDTTVVPALTSSTCESLTGWTRYQNLGYSNGYMNSYALDGYFVSEGSWAILACAYSIWASSALVEFGQSATLEVGTPYKLYYDWRVGGGSWSVITVRINDAAIKTYTYSTTVDSIQYAEYVQFTPTVESNKLSWHVYTNTGSKNTCIRLDNVILIKDITSVTVSSYGAIEYCALLHNTVDVSCVNSMYMSNVGQLDILIEPTGTSTSQSIVSVRNGGFEAGNFESYNDVAAYDGEIELFDVWTVAASAKQTGTFGAQCDIDAGEFAYMYKPLVITAEQTTLGIWFRMPTCDISGEGYIELTIQLLNSGYDYVDTLFDDIFVAGTSSFEWAAATCDVSLYSGDFILYTRIHSITGGGGGE